MYGARTVTVSFGIKNKISKIKFGIEKKKQLKNKIQALKVMLFIYFSTRVFQWQSAFCSSCPSFFNVSWNVGQTKQKLTLKKEWLAEKVKKI